jgi:predicted RNase H-like nuclease
MRIIGIDLAWADTTDRRRANETGIIATDPDGTVIDAGWTAGVDDTITWINDHAVGNTLLMIDAPLVVDNPTGQRACERECGQRYGRWQVSCNSTNQASPRLAGVDLALRLAVHGWVYSSGTAGPRVAGRVMHECYPYATLVGAHEFGYDQQRPPYKRKPKSMRTAEFRLARAEVCNDLIARLATASTGDGPPINLAGHPVTKTLCDEPSPYADRDYKHREDLIDAAICAWTGLLWTRHGLTRCQILGDTSIDTTATIIAPARPEQRRPPPSR